MDALHSDSYAQNKFSNGHVNPLVNRQVALNSYSSNYDLPRCNQLFFWARVTGNFQTLKNFHFARSEEINLVFWFEVLEKAIFGF